VLDRTQRQTVAHLNPTRRVDESPLPRFDPAFEIDPAAVVEAAAESVLVTTADLDPPGPTILYVNPAFEKMTGWSRADVVGKSPRILQGPNTNRRVFADLRQTLLAGRAWQALAINYRKDGSEFFMEWSIVPLKDSRGEIYQYVAVQRDVTGRIEADRRLGEAQAAERRADRARTNLARYFSPKLVDILATKDQPLGPVRRQVLAVLFADIAGFTSLAETLPPEQVVELLRDTHKWMEKVIFAHDGLIAGYIGDAILTIFGVPEPGDQDAVRALSCAYELQIAARRWNRKRMLRNLPAIRIGLGLHYGSAVLGDIGTEQYVEFTVIGDTVNTASRLQQATRTIDCDLVVSQDLVRAVMDKAQGSEQQALLQRLRHHGDLAIRGRSQAIQIWTHKQG
jgi:PAS domain S-box-containing protein